MALFRLSRFNRLVLVALTAVVVAVAVRTPALGPLSALTTLGPLAELPREGVRYGLLVAAWAGGAFAVLVWQGTLWTTMGSGAGFRTGGSTVLRLAPMKATVRERVVTAEAVRHGWSPLARLRVSAPFEAPDPAAAFELAITTDSDPDGRVLFEAPDADRRYVLRAGEGDVEAVLSTDFRAQLLEVETSGLLRVGRSHVHYDVEHLPFDAACLRTCAETTARLAERVEQASGDRRGGV